MKKIFICLTLLVSLVVSALIFNRKALAEANCPGQTSTNCPNNISCYSSVKVVDKTSDCDSNQCYRVFETPYQHIRCYIVDTAAYLTAYPTESAKVFDQVLNHLNNQNSEKGAVDFSEIQRQFSDATGLKAIFTFDPNASVADKVGLIIGEVLKYVFVIAGLLLLFFLISGGFQLLLSAGNEKTMEMAKNKITNAIFGFLLLFLSYWLVQILEFILGISVI